MAGPAVSIPMTSPRPILYAIASFSVNCVAALIGTTVLESGFVDAAFLSNIRKLAKEVPKREVPDSAVSEKQDSSNEASHSDA